MSRISFDVVEVSGKPRDAIPLRFLSGEPWISAPNCNYPQVLIIRLSQPSHVSSIELLIHRKFIPSRMDLYAAASKLNAIPPLHQFVLLGDIKFREKKADTGRHELKTIFVDTNATFLRFAFGRNYRAASNSRNQIGIVELNVFGDSTATFDRTASTVSIFRPRGASRRSDLSTTKSSLSSTSIWRMASRGSTRSTSRSGSKSTATVELRAALQRAVETKRQAADDENFALAKAAQRAQVQLELVLKQIRDAERTKRKAVDDDDFDRAQSLTDQIRTLRENAMQQVDSRFFVAAVPSDPRPATSQTVKTSVSAKSNGTSASSVLRRFQDGRLKIDSPLPADAQPAPTFRPIPLTPSDVSEYPKASRLSPSVAEGSLPPPSPASGSIALSAGGSAVSRPSASPHSPSIAPSVAPSGAPSGTPSSMSITTPSIVSRGSTVCSRPTPPLPPLPPDLRLPILPDSRLPNVRRLSDPTVYRTDQQDEKNSTSSSLGSRLSALFSRSADRPTGRVENKRVVLPPPPQPPARNRFLEKENQVVGGARRKRSPPIDENGEESITLEALLETLPATDRPLVTLAADNFGLEAVANVYSRNWEERQKGYRQIQEFLTNQNPSKQKARDIVKAVEPLVVRGLSDKLFNVYAAALGLLKTLITHFIVIHALVEGDGPRLVNATYDLLISRTGDTVDKRFSSSTFSAVQELLQGDTRVSNAYMTKFMLPFDAKHSVRCDRGKAKIVVDGTAALYTLRLPALTVKKTCEFALLCLNHTDAKVRDYGRKLVVFVYERENRDEVRMNLPRRTQATKNYALRNLLNDLDAIDERLGGGGANLQLGQLPDRNDRNGNDTPQSKGNGGSRGRANRTSSSTRSPTRLSRDRSRPEPRAVRIISDKPEDADDPIDYTQVCMYCGQLSPKFNLAGLEQHYEKDCAMLTTCPSCSEVVETRYLSEHELFECEKRLNFKQCERCQQAVVADLYARHKTSKKCKLLPADGSVGRCPLCSEDVLPNNDLGWRTHLMSECPSNPRLKRRKKKPKAAAK